MAGRVIVGVFVLGYHLITRSDIVYASVASQLLNLWPVNSAAVCVVRWFGPINGWVFVRLAFFAYFVLTCAGLVMLTWKPAARDRGWPRLLRPLAFGSAAVGVAYTLVLCAAMDHNWRRVYDPLVSNWMVLCAYSIPPVALEAWTIRLLIRTRISRTARIVAYIAVVVTAIAAVYNTDWPYSRGTIARLGLLANVTTFAGVCWLWWELRQRTRPPACVDTML